MGVVYEALDSDLGRKVAVKVLPAKTAGDPNRLERFRREARAVAALNHPNIVTIHGIESADDKHFLVMELVEGQSLDRMIGEEGMSLRQVFDVAIPIAGALSAAHAKGVVHRDIKPANVMVTPEGQVKVLDFGLGEGGGCAGFSRRRDARRNANNASHRRRRGRRHRALHVSRTVARARGGPARRHLLAGCRAVRDGNRKTTVRRRKRNRSGVEHSQGHARVGQRGARRPAAATGANHPPVPGEESRPEVPDRSRRSQPA